MRQRIIHDERKKIFLIRLVVWLRRRILLLAGRQPPRGFRRTDINGKKRHFALLVASMLSGMGGIRPINLSTGGNNAVIDPFVYHERIVHTAHHHRVASYSSSSVYDVIGGGGLFSSLSASSRIQQNYIKRWVRSQKQQRKQEQ